MLKQMQCDKINIRRLFTYFIELRTIHALQILGGGHARHAPDVILPAGVKISRFSDPLPSLPLKFEIFRFLKMSTS